MDAVLGIIYGEMKTALFAAAWLVFVARCLLLRFVARDAREK